MIKYKTIETPTNHECGFCWWDPEEAAMVIEYIEADNPGYEFVQFVTSPGNGGYPDFIILRIKNQGA